MRRDDATRRCDGSTAINICLFTQVFVTLVVVVVVSCANYKNNNKRHKARDSFHKPKKCTQKVLKYLCICMWPAHTHTYRCICVYSQKLSDRKKLREKNKSVAPIWFYELAWFCFRLGPHAVLTSVRRISFTFSIVQHTDTAAWGAGVCVCVCESCNCAGSKKARCASLLSRSRSLCTSLCLSLSLFCVLCLRCLLYRFRVEACGRIRFGSCALPFKPDHQLSQLSDTFLLCQRASVGSSCL